MSIFLSASIPVPGRGDYYLTADPYLIHYAVRELVLTVLGRKKLVWGGHPAITPMVWAACEDLGVNYAQNVTLYQSRHFCEFFPEENKKFRNVIYIDEVNNDRESSLLEMRIHMFTENEYSAAVFIGGMDGIEAEYNLLKKLQSSCAILALGAPGGASRNLAQRLALPEDLCSSINFTSIFHKHLCITYGAERNAI
jgi:hypothetical protein